jgi:alpha-amylase
MRLFSVSLRLLTAAGVLLAGAMTSPLPLPAQRSTPMAPAQVSHPAWTRSAVIYEVNIRQYTPAGTLAAFTRELPRLRDLGVDILWIMPVQPIGKLRRKGTLGSYYSIADYTAINPEFGTEADFRAMVREAHRLGLRVILDWVANHTSHDHEWIGPHKEWYTLKADGSVSRPVDPSGKETDWDDVADLNYTNRDMRTAMISEMQWWVERMEIDGFRCDVAGFVPNDFWAEATRALRAVDPDLFFLAEWDDPSLHSYFDATYNWGLFHLMNDVASGKKLPAAIDAYQAADRQKFPAGAYRLNFTSNHDENTWNGTEFERMGANAQVAYVVSATLQNALPLLYSGQEASFNRRLPFFEKDSIDWSGPSLASFYHSVFALKRANAVLWNGEAGAPQVPLAHDGGPQVYGFVRARGGKSVVVLANFGDAVRTVSYRGLAPTGVYRDWFSGAPVPLRTTGTVDVPPHGYRVLVK